MDPKLEPSDQDISQFKEDLINPEIKTDPLDLMEAGDQSIDSDFFKVSARSLSKPYF